MSDVWVLLESQAKWRCAERVTLASSRYESGRSESVEKLGSLIEFCDSSMDSIDAVCVSVGRLKSRKFCRDGGCDCFSAVPNEPSIVHIA